MSSISGLGQGLSQFIQSLQGSGSSNTSNTQGLSQFIQSLQSSNSSSSTSGSSNANSALSSISQDIAKLTGHAGKHHQHALFKKISDAVVGALNSTSTASAGSAVYGPNPPSSATTTDPNQKIENAIVNILKSTTNTTNSSGMVSDPDGDDDNSTSPGQALLQSLQQNGVTPQQFRNDLLAALQQTQGSTQSFGPLEANFPTGLLVNTVA
jgi:hypothetical protein